MSKVIEGQIAKPCLFDNSIECPTRKALEGAGEPVRMGIPEILEYACPICPIRAELMKVKHTLK